MKKELISKLHGEFEKCAQCQEGVECWLARDLQKLLGYEKWDNFLKVIEKAKMACFNSKHDIKDHFADVGKMVTIGSGAPRDIDDIKLTRYACYLIAKHQSRSRSKQIKTNLKIDSYGRMPPYITAC